MLRGTWAHLLCTRGETEAGLRVLRFAYDKASSRQLKEAIWVLMVRITRIPKSCYGSSEARDKPQKKLAEPRSPAGAGPSAPTGTNGAS